MKVFLDTNVVIDFLAKRELFFEDAERIFSLAEDPAYELCISALSFTNIAYILRKHTSSTQLLSLLDSLFRTHDRAADRSGRHRGGLARRVL